MFEELRTRTHRVGRRTFRSPPNAGFGHRMPQTIDGKPLIHVGADLAWFREGEPVYAVAGGVVRMSAGPDPPDDRDKRPTRAELSPAARSADNVAPWGNLVVIEHRLNDGSFVTTIYGHLNSQRLVQTGDLVEAGQRIGAVGRQHVQINGGYRPHLHFGIREGRLAEAGRMIMPLNLGGDVVEARIRTLDEHELTLDVGQPPRAGLGDFTMTVAGTTFKFRRRGEAYTVPSRILWAIPTTPDFPLVGYATSIEGFVEPTGFLRKHRADRDPAPFLRHPQPG